MKLLKGLKIFLPQTHTDGHRHLSGRPGRIKIAIASRWMVEKLRGLEDRKNRLRDRSTRIRLLRRLEKVQRGLLGDVNSVGDGVYEMREFFGPGWRMYYIQRGEMLIIMLGGGDKSTQIKDIATAKATALTIKE